MDKIRIENFTVGSAIIRQWFCNENFSHSEVYHIFNISCKTKHQFVEDLKLNPSLIFITSVAAFIFVFGLISNFGLLVTLYTKKRYWKPSWYYVCSLVIADMMVLVTMQVFVFYIIFPPKHLSITVRTYLFPSLDMFLSSASMLSVAAIALDRVLSVSSHQIMYGKKRRHIVKYVLSAIWLYCFLILILALCRMALSNTETYNLVVFWLATIITFFASVTVTFISYIVMTFICLKNILCDKSTIGVTAKHFLSSCNHSYNYTAAKKRSMLKAFSLCFSSLPFVLGWCFYLGIQTYEVLTQQIFINYYLNMAMLVIPWTISALNPIIYISTSKSLRHEMAFLRCFYKDKSNTISTCVEDI